MSFRFGLKGKTIAVTIILILIIGVSGLVAVNRGIYLTSSLLGQQAIKAAETAFQIIEPDKFETLLLNGNDAHPYYKELQDKLKQTRMLLGLEYLYTMSINDKGEYIYVVDGMSPEENDFSSFGDVESNRAYYKSYDRAMKGEIVKDNFSMNEKWGNLVSAYIPIRNQSGEVIGFLGVDLDASDMLGVMNDNTIFMIIFVAVISVIGVVATLIINYQIALPIMQLRDYSVKLLKGEAAYQLNIKSDDEIGDLAYILNSKIAAIKNILDNTGQGFLTFGKDMLVNTEYSLECKRIFDKDIEKMRFTELIYPHDKEQQKFLESVFEKVLREEESSKREIYLPLLEDEVLINDRSILFDYKIINSTKKDCKHEFMVIMTDITEKRDLESRMEREKNTLKMVVKIIVNHEDFLECIKEYKAFCSIGLNRIFSTNHSIKDILYEIYRTIHTFKGNFSQLDMESTVDKLHQMESELFEMKSKANHVKVKELEKFIANLNIETWLQEDLDILKQVLGEQTLTRFLSMDRAILVDKAKLIELENSMLQTLSGVECRLLLPQLRRIRSKTFRELLKPYPEYVAKLAEKMDKQIKLMIINGGSFTIDSDKYNDFAKALTHVFRNAVDHGIEPLDERIFNSKEEYGRITCDVKLIEDRIIITIKDDGRGIDFKKIRQKAIAKGLVDEKAAFKMSMEDIIDFIFTHDFSTKNEQTEFSGRGVGLAAVKKEVEKINGTIEVKTKQGKGTEFVFSLPLYKATDSLKLEIDDVINPLMLTTRAFISEQLEIPENSICCNNAGQSDRLILNKYSAYAEIRGVLCGKLIISFDEKLAGNFAMKFTIGDVPEEQKDDYIKDSVAECLNIVLGNSIKLFPGIEEYLTFSSPIVIKSDNAEFKYSQNEVWTYDMFLEAGRINLSLVTVAG